MLYSMPMRFDKKNEPVVHILLYIPRWFISIYTIVLFR